MAEINATQMRGALAWATGDEQNVHEPSSNPFIWFWEAVEGDFNENRSTSQILVDAGISMIPLVDQVCDIRDFIANCRKLARDYADAWAWVALALTLIGLFPTLGSLVKGVLKIFFGFVRRSGGEKTAEVVDAAMSWVIAFLRRRDVQKYLRSNRVDEVFKWIATEIKAVRAKINARELTTAFDRAIRVVDTLSNKVHYVPILGGKAKQVLEEVKKVRLHADQSLAEAVKPVHTIIDTIVRRFEMDALRKQHGIVDVRNIHYRGALPEGAAVALIRKRQPKWLTLQSKLAHPGIEPSKMRSEVDSLSARTTPSGAPKDDNEIFPYLTDQNIRSFNTLLADTITGPAKLYRIVAPNSRAMGDCWVTEEVFKRLQNAPDPKAAWRKYLAVWPDWNVNGQFVVYDVKVGESLNVWRGKASSQKKSQLPGAQLEGGYEQVVFNLARTDSRNDQVLYYKVVNGKSPRLGKGMTQSEVNAITASMTELQKKAFFESHLSVRQNINHPNISGPFETGWGYSEFDGAGMASKIGLPSLPGQFSAGGSG